MEYGLIGEKLGHSFSKIIHNELCDYDYQLLELEPEEVGSFMTNRDFKAINVTIPYKEAVIPHLYYVDESAQELCVFPGRVTIEVEVLLFAVECQHFVQNLWNDSKRFA